tara:strand:+ start:293 stop:2197 length:1905 start_codon:yes stop_codon:yes gene_type:complete
MADKYLIFLLSITVIFGQVSISDINSLSNQQLDLIRSELQQANSPVDIDGIDDDTDPVLETVDIAVDSPEAGSQYFGYNYFKKDINFFDNIPAPSDFRLGPGDELTLSLWGETNSREKFIINKEGLIYYENIGFINLSNKTLREAESILIEELASIYSTLKDQNNPTKLMLELGQLKSINVYFSGQIENPGINLVHPFSDVFSAIVQAGGITNNGSLRQIQIIRSNKIIEVVDFYSFFTKGNDNFSNIRILDGDIIHIPKFVIRVLVEGQTLNTGYFELLEDESISDLITYTGGLTKNASSSAVLDMIIPLTERTSNDNARISMNINLNDSKNLKITNGSILDILSIGNVETKVQVLGRVKSPGSYAASSNLKTILGLAGGFDDPLYRKTIRDDEIVIVRKDENQFYGLEFKIPYSESDSFNLVPGDKIFVYENSFYDNLFSVSVVGEVNKRGNFQLKKGMTVNDAIILAEGFTELANKDAITVTEIFSSTDELGNEIEEKTQVNDATLDFELTDGSVINVLPFENVVNIKGNVYNPGLVTYNKGKTVNKYINLAGGPKPNTLSTKIYVKRANGRIKKVTLLQGIGTIVRPGDTIVVPVDPNPSEFNPAAFTADILSVLANLVAILAILDNNND